jgi:c-di-GMP-binding flagellar brake protein YcgR
MDHRSQHSSAADSAAKSNRRIAQRAHLHVKADVTLPGDLTIVGHTLDISAGGLSLEVPYELQLGQRCEIELNLSKMGGPSWVQVIGEVRYCSAADDDTFRAGLQFVDMDDKLKETLDQYIWSRVDGPTEPTE